MKKIYYLSILTLLSAHNLFAADASGSAAAAAAAATSNSSSKAAAVTKEKAAAQATLQPGESNATHACWNLEVFDGNNKGYRVPNALIPFNKDKTLVDKIKDLLPQYKDRALTADIVGRRMAIVVSIE